MAVEQDTFEQHYRDSSVAIADYFRRSISLSEILDQLWSGRVIIAACFVIGLASGAYATWSNGPLFTAQISVIPAEGSSSVDNNSSSSSALGLLAGLTGTSIGQVSKFTQFLAALHSTGVAEILDKKYAMTCRIYNSDCDVKTLKWHERTGWQAWYNGMLARLSGLPDPNGPRTPTDLAQYITGAVVPTVDKASQVVRLDYLSSKPKFAKEFLSILVKTTNDYVRNQDRVVIRQYVDYLTDQASRATNVAQRDALDQLLLQEERKLMLTEVDVPYAATILDGPTVLPVNRALRFLAIYGALGLFIGLIAAIGLHRLHIRYGGAAL